MADAYLQQMFSYRATSTWAPTDSELGQYSVDELIVYMDYLVNAGGTATSTAGLDRALKRIPDAMPAKRALVLAKEGSGPEQVFQSWSDAVDCGGALLALAVKRASQLAFGLADPRRMLRVTEKGYACWKGMGPQERLRTWMRFVPGVHAFALEQNQMLQDAESIGKAAVEEFADDPWAVHGVAHALYYQGKLQEGVAWLQKHADTFAPCNAFMLTHGWWHLALFHVDEPRFPAALELFDQGNVWGGLSPEFRQDYWAFTGALGLLWKMELRTVHAAEALNLLDRARGPYAAAQAGLAAATSLTSPLYTLVVLRYMCDLDPGGVDALLARIATQGALGTAAFADVWARAARSIAAFYREKDPGQAHAALEGAVGQLGLLGGSSEQREVVYEYLMVLLHATAHWADLRQLLTARATQRPGVQWYQEFLRRIPSVEE